MCFQTPPTFRRHIIPEDPEEYVGHVFVNAFHKKMKISLTISVVLRMKYSANRISKQFRTWVNILFPLLAPFLSDRA